MLDFGALPPEINSGRMYVGAGSGPLLEAAAAWDELAAELQSTAASYGSTIQGLTAGPWTGPSSIAVAAAAAPYVSWMSATGAQAEQAATQAKLAAGAYEAAFAATVPPPVIAANRSLLATLIATNILGQNTPAIAATEAQYMEMWAQDAAAMYGVCGVLGERLAAAAVRRAAEDHQRLGNGGAGAGGCAVQRGVGHQRRRAAEHCVTTGRAELGCHRIAGRGIDLPCRLPLPTGTPFGRPSPGCSRRNRGAPSPAARSCRSGRHTPRLRTGRAPRPIWPARR